jgi:type IV pilus biogenesis/stability protein PilW
MTFIIRSLITCCLILSLVACAGDKAATQKRARALKDLGGAMVEHGNTRGGLAKLLEALKLDPDDADLHQQIALVYRNLGKYRLSEEHFERALDLRPRFSEAWNNLGTLYLLEGKWDRAIGWFQKAADDITYQTPQFAYNNMGLAYFNKGDHEKAVSSYQQALKLSPSYSPAFLNLGIAYEALGRQDEAVDAYKKAIQYYPEYALAHLNLGKLLLKLGRKDQAAKELKRVIEVDPKGPHVSEATRLLNKLTSEKSPVSSRQ